MLESSWRSASAGHARQLAARLIAGALYTIIDTIMPDVAATIADLHRVYRMPWPGDPRVNIQDAKGMAKPYQVMQVVRALERLEADRREEDK